MPIRVDCSACQFSFRVRDELAGKRGKCPKCRASIQVPNLESQTETGYALADETQRPPAVPRSSATASAGRPVAQSVAAKRAAEVTRPTLTPAEILTAFRGEIVPVRPSLLYRLWILLVATVMIVLPIIYLGIVAAASYALYYHATRDIVVFQTVRNARAALFVYVGPLVVGGVLLAFMIKPLFARPAQQRKPRSLDPSQEALLFAFVDGVCISVGAPRPSRIDVDCQVNASASFQGGTLSLLSGNLVLTIGLPLVAGLSLRQFAGVLAHEFGHFSQSAGMRLTYLIRSINLWFARVVYERDEWDETLAAWAREQNIYSIVVINLARLVVWLTRRVLWLLMVIGHVISSFMLRQMEFDADRYEARMVGGDVFESTMKQLNVLNVAYQGAYVDLAESWKEGRLADNLPKLVMANVAQIPARVLDELDKVIATRKTRILETHPADKDRVANARAQKSAGVFKLEGPATDVFRSFDALSRSVTLDHYRGVFGQHVSKECLHPVVEVVRGQESVLEGNKALSLFFMGTFNPLRALELPAEAPHAPADLKAARRRLEQCRIGMESALKEYKTATDRQRELIGRSIESEAAAILLKADYRIKAAEFSLPSAKLDTALAASRKASAELQGLTVPLTRFENEAVERLYLGLCFLEAAPIAARVVDAERWREECRSLYQIGVQLGGRIMPGLVALIQAQQALFNILQKLAGNEQNTRLHNAILRGGRQLRDQLQEMSWKLGATRYPFDHASGEITLSQFALPVVPAADAIGDLLQLTGEAIDKLIPLYGRLIGRLAVAALDVERALGLPPPKDVSENPTSGAVRE